jgi:hypothetical protein
MSRQRSKLKGRSDFEGGYALLPHRVHDSPNWQRLSGQAVKVLCAMNRQFNGRNNGDLCGARRTMQRYGFTRDTIEQRRELVHYGFLHLTRQGGLNMGPSLYAVTWLPIDDCGGKLDCPPTRVAPGTWKEPRPEFKRTGKKKRPPRAP